MCGKPSNFFQMNQTFGKKEKLKSKILITQLFNEGKGVTSFPLKLIYLPVQHSSISIITGVTVPKRNFKSAVDRNRIKRLLRESYRLNKALVFNNTDANFAFLFLYLGKDMPSFELVNQKMKLVLNKFKLQINEKNSK